ncbi:MAG: DUF1499 domain-containing protein [Balneolaceae bacterium]|nr:DUF1499 domain-containing protein [Balneolaceae bacterium]
MKFSRILFYLSLITAAIFILSGYGYQWEIWGLGTGFTLLRYSAYAAIALTAISGVSYWFVRKSEMRAKAYVVITFLLMGTASLTALYWMTQARSVPPIHDITTDIDNPPQFSAMVRLREDAPNPPEYAGEETAEAQREAYPYIQPLMLQAGVQEVMDVAVELIEDRGWELVAINRKDYRIEATEKLAWFGFKDDVVLRFTETENGTRVDMRSKSRIGRSDVGVNANRIERFLSDLENRME